MARSSIAYFMFVVLIDSVGLGVIIPVMPMLLETIGGADVSHAAAVGGWLVFAYAIAQFVCAPVVGALGDRFGRRPVLLVSLATFALDYAVMAVAPALWMLFAGRIVAGIAGASYSVANAAVADVTPPAERAKNFGLMGLAFGVGFILGPLVGGSIGGLGPRAPFVFAALLGALNALYGLFFVPETLARENRRPLSFGSANPLAAARDIGRRREIRAVLGAFFLWQLAFQALPATWAYYTKAAFNWNAAAVGMSLAFGGLMMAIAQGALVGPAVKRLGERRAAMLGLAAGVLAYACYAFATAGWMLYAGMTCWALGGLVTPSCNAMMSARLGPDRQGELQGIVAASASLSAIVAPVAMTQLFARAGPSTPWIAAAILAALAIPIVSATSHGRSVSAEEPA